MGVVNKATPHDIVRRRVTREAVSEDMGTMIRSEVRAVE